MGRRERAMKTKSCYVIIEDIIIQGEVWQIREQTSVLNKKESFLI